jgi:hypothetical protein
MKQHEQGFTGRPFAGSGLSDNPSQ